MRTQDKIKSLHQPLNDLNYDLNQVISQDYQKVTDKFFDAPNFELKNPLYEKLNIKD